MPKRRSFDVRATAKQDMDESADATHAARRDASHAVLAFDANASHSLTIRARAFVFSDPRSRALLPLIDKVAPSDASVLITGETGTGKELVARYVHARSKRAGAPFVAINCGAFSETLIEGELFGYEKGAFTGATMARAGWFEAAKGGTLFLDEIGDLPLPLQVKLLRVLQEREVVRLGSRKPIPLDIRLIAATNIDLERSVAAGNFRQDLFYRLQVVSLPLLPLRERRADILPLARHFLELYGDRLQPRRLDLSSATEEALYAYPWPGNIRELENALHRATLTCQDGMIQPSDLRLPLQHAAHPAAAAVEPADTTLEQRVVALTSRLVGEGQEDLLDRIVRTAVTEAFRLSGDNQIKAAAMLGVTRNVVRTHLKNFGLI
ncbi:sigma-54 interaction domain-containing protein [Sphingomonas profundi]|uniref:sigma-54 interaction domain-containing protein n=1 Tax=Alterirhizorhabdus profundi TaxID=2681549 RepID=UPI001E61A7DB|nr:sigma 54-interacting transcriptional regulator [Sphingomonas profundi]